MVTKRRARGGIVVFATALLAAAPDAAQAQAQQDDPCLPTATRSYWTLDEVELNQRTIARMEKEPGVRIDPPVVGPNLSKYLDCKRWMRDSETYVVHELLMKYEVMQGIPRLFDAGAELSLGYAGFERLGPLGAMVKGKVTKGLHDALFGDLEKTGIVPLIENMFVELQKQHPNDSLEAILGRVTGELRRPGSGFTGLAPESIRYFESTVRDLGLRQMLGTWKAHKPTEQQVSAAKTRLLESNKAIAAKSKAVEEAKQQAAKVGDSIKKVSSPASSPSASATDWTRLTGVYRQLVSTSGREQAEKVLTKAASDPVLQKSLGLSPAEAKALSEDIASKAALREASASARALADKSKEFAELAGNLGWADGAFQFSNLASAASSFEQITTALASSAGPPGPWQMVGTANSAFALAGALSNAFGGRQKRDDSLAKALGQILEGLRSINRQIADMRQEQREHFAYSERFLEVLVEMSATDALSGIGACQRTLLAYTAWASAADTPDVRAALARPGPANELRLRASQCKDWLWDARAIPLGPGGVNIVYKQLLTVANEVAAKHQPAMAGFKNLGFLRTESHYPQLRSLVEADEAPGLLSERRNWLDQPTKAVDINQRLSLVGHTVAADWTVARLSGHLLSTSTVVTAAEAALLLQPAAAALSSDGLLRVLDEAEADIAHGTHASVLRDLYGLALTALAQENLIAGGPVASLVDQLLAQGDTREAQLQVQECIASTNASRIACALSLGVPADEVQEACALEPKPDAATLCARLGAHRFEEKVKAARVAVANFPTLRQNVLAARLWRLSSRDATRERWSPGYAHALEQRVDTLDPGLDAGGVALRRLFKDMPVVQLGKTQIADNRNDQYLEEGIYFSRLSGDCDGITERALIGVAICKQGRCDARIGKDDEGRLRILNAETGKPHSSKPDDPQLCTMAALPSAQEFGQARILETMSLLRVRDVVERLAMALAFDHVYASTAPGNHSERWAIIDSLRPAASNTYSGGLEK